jgi:hypothetical protein
VSEETSKYYLCDLLASKTFDFIMSFSDLLFKSNEVNSPRNSLDKKDFKEFFKVGERQEKQFDYLKNDPYSRYKYSDDEYGTYYYIPLQTIFSKDIINKLKNIKSEDPYMVNQVPSILKIMGIVRLKLIGGSKNKNGFLCLDAPVLPEVDRKCSGAAINANNVLYVPFLDVQTHSPLPLSRYHTQLSKSIIHEFRHLFDNIIDKMNIGYSEKKGGDDYSDYLGRPTERNAHFETMAKEIEKFLTNKIREVNKAYTEISKTNNRYSDRDPIKEDPWDYNSYVEQRNKLIDITSSTKSFLSYLNEFYYMVFLDKSSSNFWNFAKDNPEARQELIKRITDVFVDFKAKYKNVLPVKKYEKKTSIYVDEKTKE